MSQADTITDALGEVFYYKPKHKLCGSCIFYGDLVCTYRADVIPQAHAQGCSLYTEDVFNDHGRK